MICIGSLTTSCCFKNHPKDTYNKSRLLWIYLISSMQENTFMWLDIDLLKHHQNLKFRLITFLTYIAFHCLTTFAWLKAKWSIVWLQFYATRINALVGFAFWGPSKFRVSVPCLSFLSSIRPFFFCMQWIHIRVLILSLNRISRHYSTTAQLLDKVLDTGCIATYKLVENEQLYITPLNNLITWTRWPYHLLVWLYCNDHTWLDVDMICSSRAVTYL